MNVISKYLKPCTQLTLQTRNIRSLPLHALELAAHPAHYIAVQEADVPEHAKAHIRQQLSDHDRDVHYGNITNLAKDGTRWGRRVAVSAKYPLRLIESEDDDDNIRYLRSTGRWQEHLVMAGDGNEGIYVANIYGYAGASSDEAAYRQNETLLAAATIRAATYGKRCPSFLIGDINIQPDQSKVLAKAIDDKLLFDVAADWAPLEGPTNTFRREGVVQGMDGPGTSRIDVILANHTGAVMVTQVEYLWEEAIGFDHVPIQVTLAYEALNYTICVPKHTEQTNIQDIKDQRWTESAKDELYRAIWQDHEADYSCALDNEDVEDAHRIWCKGFQEYLNLLQTPQARTSKQPREMAAQRKGQSLPFQTTTVGKTYEDQPYMKPERCRIRLANTIAGQCRTMIGVEHHLNRPTTLHCTWQRHVQKLNELRKEDDDQADTKQEYNIDELKQMAEAAEKSAKQRVTNELKRNRDIAKKKLTEKSTGLAHTCKYIKGKRRQPTTVLHDPITNKPTTEPTRLHRLFLDHFEPVYQTHKDQPPQFTTMRDHPDIGPHFCQHQGAPQGPPPPTLLHRQAKRATSHGAPGLDDIRPIEAALLPLVAWEQRYRLLHLCYQRNRFPQAYRDLASPALKKGGKYDNIPDTDPKDASSTARNAHIDAHFQKPEQHRLLGVFSALYRIESGAIYRQHMEWINQWIHPDLHGCIQGHDLADVAWDAQADIETAHINGLEKVIFSLDYVKFFDMFHPDWVKDFLIHTGFDPQMVCTIHDLYTNLRRRIKLGKHYGPVFHPANGMAAGDSLALMVALIFVSTQFYYVQHHHPQLKMGACVDDRNIRGDYHDVVKAYGLMAHFDHLAGHFNNHKKLQAMATTTNARQKIKHLNFGTTQQPVTPTVCTQATLVGETLNTQLRAHRRSADNRTLYALEAAKRCQYTPTSQRNKALALAMVAIPRMLTGCAWSMPPTNSLKRLRTAILTSIWSQQRAMRATEVVIAVLHDPTRVDPWGAIVYRTLMFTRRTCLRDEQRVAHLHQVERHLKDNPHSQTQGPGHTFYQIIHLLELTVKLHNRTIDIKDHLGLKIDLLRDPVTYVKKVIVHWVRNAFTRALSQRTLSHLGEDEVRQYRTDNPSYQGYRKDFYQMPQLVDQHATTHNFTNYKNDPHGLNILKSFIAGSVRAGDRLKAAKCIEDDTCTHPQCQKCRHTTKHLVWHCHHHKTTREPYLQAIAELHKKATRQHGNFAAQHLEQIAKNNAFMHTSVCPDDEAAYTHHKTRQIEDIPTILPNPTCFTHSHTDGLNYEEHNQIRYVRVATDGSTIMPTSLLHASAGWAVYYGPQHPLNYASGLADRHQSSFRAEARAVLHVLLHATLPTIVFIDCQGVVNELHRLQSGTASAWGVDPDIWERIQHIIYNTPTYWFRFQWMPSHLNDPKRKAKRKRYLNTGGTLRDIEDNDQADKMAAQAAGRSVAATQRAALAGYRAELTKIVQDMMVDIWKQERRRNGHSQDSNQHGTVDDIMIADIMEDDLRQHTRMDEDIHEAVHHRPDCHDEEDPWADHIDMDGNEIHAPKPEPPAREQQQTQSVDIQTQSECDNQQCHQQQTKTQRIQQHIHTNPTTFPNYPIDQGTIPIDPVPWTVQCNLPLHRLPTNVKFATDKNGDKVNMRIHVNWWEPYQWFFHQIQWSWHMAEAPTQKVLQRYQTTYCEMAIACDIMTGGVIARGTDLRTKTWMMRAAFAHYHRKAYLTYGLQDIRPNDFFDPVPYAGSLTLLGAERMAGVKRRMILKGGPDIPSIIAANIVEANQSIRQGNAFGQGYMISKVRKPDWVHEALTNVQLLCHEEASRIRQQQKQTQPNKSNQVQSRRRPRRGPCFFGHLTTSGVDRVGRPRWNAAPQGATACLWPGIPPGATMCQRCYEHYRAALSRGDIPSIPAKPGKS